MYRIIELLISTFKSNKNSLVRLRVAQYMEIIINRYDLGFIQKSQNQFEKEFLITGIDDTAQEVRSQVRIVFKAYYTIPEFKDRVQQILREMKTIGKKQLLIELNDNSPTRHNFGASNNGRSGSSRLQRVNSRLEIASR